MNLNLILNEERLAKASNKFLKACDQIKILKKRIAELIAMFTYYDPQSSTLRNQINSIENDLNVARIRESVRQQIENLQGIKTAYFMYAHQKADEITKLQCELYGEDAVREAYEHDTTSSSSTSIQEEPQVDSNENSSNLNDEYNESSNEEASRNEEDRQFESWAAYPQQVSEQHHSNAWTSWQFNPTPITHYNHQFSV